MLKNAKNGGITNDDERRNSFDTVHTLISSADVLDAKVHV